MTQNYFITSSGEKIPIVITTRRGLRNITLRPKTAPRREIHISKPWLTLAATALRFVEQKRQWLDRYFARAPQKQKLKPGDTIEILGQQILLRHDPAKKSNTFNADDLIIGGDIAHFERRVRDFIRAELLREIKKIIKQSQIPSPQSPKRITLRDTTSRWGSCSTSGTISFSWRLAFAPYDVMRYVVMHELAHCKFMDHSPEFWRTVGELYGPGIPRAKRWLAQHGVQLHKYL